MSLWQGRVGVEVGKWREEHGRRFRNGGYGMTALRLRFFNLHPEQKGFILFPF